MRRFVAARQPQYIRLPCPLSLQRGARRLMSLGSPMARATGRIRWILVLVLFLLSGVAYLDRVNLSIAGRFVAEAYGLTNVQLGTVFSAFILGYALFQAPAGRLADRYGPQWVLVTGVIWWSVFTTLTGLMPSRIVFALPAFLAVRFLLGVGEAVVYPASNRVVAIWIPTPERGLANGILFAGVGVGAGIATPLVTAVLGRYGWRWSFYVCALIGLMVAAIWSVVGRNAPDRHPWVRQPERDHIARGVPHEAVTADSVSWLAIARDRNVLALTLGYATFGYAAYIFFSWFFIYVNTVRGLDLKATSYFTMLPFLAMALGSPLGGWLADRLIPRLGLRKARTTVAMVGLVAAAGFMALGVRVQEAGLASVVLAGGAGALYLSSSSFWSTTADIGGSSAGAVSGVMNMGNQLAGAFTSTLTPAIANTFGWSASFLVASVLLLLGAAAWLLVDPERSLLKQGLQGPT